MESGEGGKKPDDAAMLSDDRVRRSSARVELARANFVRKMSLSSSLSNLSHAPARYRVASGRSEFGADGAAFRTDENRLAGWVLVQKMKTSGETRRLVWRRRFIEVDMGLLSIFKTEPPVNYDVTSMDGLDMRLRFFGEKGMSIALWTRAQSEAPIMELSSQNGSKIRQVAQRIMSRRLGDSEGQNNFMTTVENSKGESVLVSWNGEIVSTFEKRFVKSMVLSGLSIETSEIATFVSGASASHKIRVANAEGEDVVLTVPDSLVLLQWCGAIGSSDVAAAKAGKSPVFSSTENVFQAVIVHEARQAPEKQRSMSFGLRATLGLDPETDNLIPSKDEIKHAMVALANLPDLRGQSMRQLLQDPIMKRFIFQWSKTQYCSESVKFLTACEHLNAEKDVSRRAQGLRAIAEEYISSGGLNSVNIGGASRKKILARIKQVGENDDATLAGLLPDILDQPIKETIRVLEFDLHPQFTLLLNEVFETRLQMMSRPESPPPAAVVETAAVYEPLTSPKSGSPRAGGSPRFGRTSRAASVSAIESNASDQALDVIDVSKLRSVKEMFAYDGMMQELLLFCSAKLDQDAVLFLSLVSQFKKSPDPIRINMARNIQKQFLDTGSPSYLTFLNETRRAATAQDLQEKLLCPPISLFDHQLGETFLYCDQSLFKRFQKARAPERKKKGLFGKTLGKKQSGKLKTEMESRRNSRLSASALNTGSLQAAGASAQNDNKLLY